MVASFFRQGGKRAGLENLYTQTVNVQQKAYGGMWAGYCTADKLLELTGVLLGMQHMLGKMCTSLVWDFMSSVAAVVLQNMP